jgi:hypothetical protein
MARSLPPHSPRVEILGRSSWRKRATQYRRGIIRSRRTSPSTTRRRRSLRRAVQARRGGGWKGEALPAGSPSPGEPACFSSSRSPLGLPRRGSGLAGDLGGEPHVRGSRSHHTGSRPLRHRDPRNHLFKPLSWKIGHPTYAGTPWSVKNILELKNARRVLAEGQRPRKQLASRPEWVRHPLHGPESGRWSTVVHGLQNRSTPASARGTDWASAQPAAERPLRRRPPVAGGTDRGDSARSDCAPPPDDRWPD